MTSETPATWFGSIAVSTTILPGRQRPAALLKLGAAEPHRPVLWTLEGLADLTSALHHVGTLDVEAVVLTGNDHSFGSGADLNVLNSSTSVAEATEAARLGWRAFRTLADLPIPSFALITDKAFSGADTLATSYALAAAIRTLHAERPVDLVFTGKQTIDGDTAQVGPGIAKRLDLGLLTYVARIVELDLAGQRIVVERRAEGGVQVLETALPVLITMLEGTNELRFATTPDMFRAARAEIRTWDRAQTGVEDVKYVGLKGSPTVVSRVFGPTPRAEKAVCIDFDPDNPDAAAAALLDKVLAESPRAAKELARRRPGGANEE